MYGLIRTHVRPGDGQCSGKAVKDKRNDGKQNRHTVRHPPERPAQLEFARRWQLPACRHQQPGGDRERELLEDEASPDDCSKRCRGRQINESDNGHDDTVGCQSPHWDLKRGMDTLDEFGAEQCIVSGKGPRQARRCLLVAADGDEGAQEQYGREDSGCRLG